MRDRILAFFLLLLFAPLMLCIMAISFCVYRKNVFYTSARLGLHKRPFQMMKFRSLQAWSSEKLEAYLDEHPESHREWLEHRKLTRDPRGAGWGMFLRHSSLDELPQLLNVVRGDMALVGPRPIVQEEDKLYGKYSDVIHSVKPGMTGLWQVSGRSLTTFHRRIAINVYYVRHRTWHLDVWILLKTLGAVFSQRGAY